MTGFRAVYGSHPLHLLTLIAGFALFGYVLATIKPATLWNPNTWWQSIVVWFAAAIIAHDLVLFPVYALVDRILLAGSRIRPPGRDVGSGAELRTGARTGRRVDAADVPARNHRAGRADVRRRHRPDAGAVPGSVAVVDRGDVRDQRRALYAIRLVSARRVTRTPG